MSACPTCDSEVAAGSRWCTICHSNVVDPSVGQLASPGKRFGAYILDLAIPILAFFLILASAGAAGSSASDPDQGLGFAVVIIFVLGFGYIIWALRLFTKGTTPGKSILGMYVVRESGERATFGTMLFREWIGKWISGFVFGLGFLWILFDKDRQGWHDKLASTYVVDGSS